MNSVKTPLKIVVELYRMAGKPVINGVYLPLSLTYSLKTDQLIKELVSSSNYKNYVIDDELSVDNVTIDNAEIPDNWTQCSITLKLPRDSIHRFHESISDLIKSPSVRNGEFPSDFYLMDIDYYTDDSITPSIVDKLERICRLIKALAKLAHYYDKKSTDGVPRLVFILGSEGKSRTAILQPIITEEMLSYEDLEYGVIEQLQEEFSQSDVNHHIEKRGIFRNTIVEFINDNNYVFVDLIKNWTSFRLSYDNNLSIYLSGFSFHKARKEVASAELDFSEKTSKTISELTTKTLAIPVSLIAALGVLKVEGFGQQLLVLTGVALTSIIVHLLTLSQKKQLIRISHAKELVFAPFKTKLKQYPEGLKNDIETTLKNLEQNESFSHILLNLFFIISWLPTIVGIIIIISKNYCK